VSRDRLKAPLAVGLVLMLLLCGVVLGSRTASPRADFAFCNQAEPASLDPAVSTGVPDARILRALFEGLTRPDPATNQPLPGVAERWTTSADGLLWSFHLRESARWSNGDPVTAQDFVYSLRRVLDPRTASRTAYLLWCIDGAQDYTASSPEFPPDPAGLGIDAPSPRELRIRLRRPAPYLASLLAYHTFAPVHRRCLEEHGPLWMKPENIVGNGPFTLTERRLRDRIRLERSETYWGREEVALQSVVAYAAGGITTQLNMYLLGDVDWMVKPPPGLYRSLEGREDLVVGGQLGSTFMRFNTWGGPFADPPRDSPFRDVAVRTALTLALDRHALARDVMRGGQEPLDSYVPAGLADYEPAVLPPPDVERARTLLAEAGYPDGKGFPRFALLYPHNETTRDFCEAVATRWRRTLGIECELVNQVFGVYLDSSASGLYDVAWGAWIGDYLDPSTFLEVFLGNSGNNRTGWSNPRYDALVQEAGGEPDVSRRASLYQQAEAILLEELPIAPVYQRVNINLVSPRVQGFHDNLLDMHPLRDISVTERAR
jgi:oligopeptide transport system substrate-binding protein